ncbi:MAG: hydrogenase maturation nickel metallochaperone HypA [Clostridiales bacterium]|nr:hydrogenase maturation nickel metallochaperone HypA [Candidatus Crickella caballi]
MHEVTLIYGIADVVEKTEKENGIDHIDSVVVQIGELSGVITEFLDKYYPMFAETIPALAGSKLIIEDVPAIGRCNDCGTEFDIVAEEGVCPNCESRRKTVLSGTDFFIKEIRVFEEA